MLRAVPSSFRAAARKLMRRRGVVGVFWGASEPGSRERRLRVHVERKLPLDELSPGQAIADRVDALRTRVTQVGKPRGFVITCKDLVRPPGEDRVSTLTAMVREGEDWFALLSGHGTLPIVGGAYRASFDAQQDPARLELLDVSSGSELRAALLTGRLSSTQDFGLAKVEITGDIDPTCPVTKSFRPPIRTSALAGNEPLKQFSSLDRIMKRGTVTAFGEVRLTLHDGNKYRFAGVFEVHGSTGAFAREGDSGSLVADAKDRVIGVIIGGSDPSSDPNRATYVLPLVSADGSIAANLRRFFG